MSEDSTLTPRSQYQVPADFSVKAAWLMRVLADKQLSNGAKVVATRLLHYHNDKSGRCDPRQGVLAEAVGMARQKVNELVAELIASGWIAAGRIKGAGSLYRLEVDRSEAIALPRKNKRTPPKRQGLSGLPDRGVSDLPDNGCPAMETTVVSITGQGVVTATGHRTTQGNNPPKPQENHPPQPRQTAAVIPLRDPAGPRLAPVPEDPDAVINGVRIPTATLREWESSFRSIRVRAELVGLTTWLHKRRVPEDQHVDTLASALTRKDADAVRGEREARIRAEADAKHAAARARPRPAI